MDFKTDAVYGLIVAVVLGLTPMFLNGAEAMNSASKVNALTYDSAPNSTKTSDSMVAAEAANDSGIVYFSASTKSGGNGTASAPYPCGGRDTGVVVNRLTLPAGSSLFFLPGIYSVSTPIYMRDDWTIDGGAHQTTTFVATTRLSSGFSRGTNRVVQSILSNSVYGWSGSASTSGTVVRNLTLNGNASNRSTASAITFYGGNKHSVRNVHFTNFPARVHDAWAILSFCINNNNPRQVSTGHVVSDCLFDGFFLNTSTFSGIGACVGVYSSNDPNPNAQYTEASVFNNRFIGGPGNTHAAWHSFGARGKFFNNYVKGMLRGVWQDTFALDDFTASGNTFDSVLGSALYIEVGAPSRNLKIVDNNVYGAGGFDCLKAARFSGVLIAGNSFVMDRQNDGAFHLRDCTNAAVLSNYFDLNGGTGLSEIRGLQFTANRYHNRAYTVFQLPIRTSTQVTLVGNDISTSHGFPVTTQSLSGVTFIGNRHDGHPVPGLSDTATAIFGTATFSRGVVTVTHSAIIPGVFIQIVQHQDGAPDSRGGEVVYSAGNGFASFTSSSTLATNSFEWRLVKVP